MASFIATAAPVRAGRPRADEVFDLSALPTRCRLELAVVLQRRHDERGRGLRPLAVRPVVAMLAASGAGSLLDRPLEEWIAALPATSRTTLAGATGFLRYAFGHIEAVVGGDGVEDEYARDRWDARRLGVPVTVGHHSVSFERIPQPWRTAVKTWARARLVGGMSWGAIRRDTTAMSWFARWLADARPRATEATILTRSTLEGYLAHLAAHGPGPNTRLGYLTSLRGSLETSRRRGWLDRPTCRRRALPRRPAPPAGGPAPVRPRGRDGPAGVRGGPGPSPRRHHPPSGGGRDRDRPAGRRRLPAGARLPGPRQCRLALPALHQQWAYAQQLFPVTARAAEAIRSQQGEVARCWPASPWLFPAPKANPRRRPAFTYNALRQRMGRWQAVIDLRGAAGRPTRVSAQRFRHTYAQTMADSGVAPSVLRDLMDHRSLSTTLGYYRVGEKRKRAAMEVLARHTVDNRGVTRPVEGEPSSVTHLREHLSWVAVPMGKCCEPTNVRAGGQPAPSATSARAAPTSSPTRPTCRSCAPTPMISARNGRPCSPRGPPTGPSSTWPARSRSSPGTSPAMRRSSTAFRSAAHRHRGSVGHPSQGSPVRAVAFGRRPTGRG